MVSCPTCVPSQLLINFLCKQDSVRNRKGNDAVQNTPQEYQKHPYVANSILITNSKHNPIQTSMKKIIPAKTSTTVKETLWA